MKNAKTILVWDPLIRIFHWLLAGAFMVAWWIEDERMPLHLLAGSIIAGLLLFRLIWGFAGTRHSRFRDFAHRPAEILAHLKALLQLKASAHTGHTPAGSAMIFALLTALVLLIGSGIALYGMQEGRGPLAVLSGHAGLSTLYALETLHGWLADGIALLVVLHIAGVIGESLLQRENLAISMITGRKSTPHPKENL